MATAGTSTTPRHTKTEDDDGASSADEMTGIFMHGGAGPNYRTAGQQPKQSNTLAPTQSHTLAPTQSQTLAPTQSQTLAPMQSHRQGSQLMFTTSDPSQQDTQERRRPTASRRSSRVGGLGKGKKGPLRSFLDQFTSIELENKGSVARDHLAIERTFLAWLRTSLAFASIGIAVTQLFRLNTESSAAPDGARTLRHIGKPLGTTFLAISILVLMLGYRRYSESQRWVIEGKFPASRGTVILVAAVAFALMVAALVVVVAVQPSAGEL